MKLGWRSVDEMRHRMSADEWLRWSVYFAREGQRKELERLKAGG